MMKKSLQFSASRKDNSEIMGNTDKKEIYKTAIYLRLSKGDGDVDGTDKAESNSITNQRMIILSFMEKHRDLKLVDTYIDMKITILIQRIDRDCLKKYRNKGFHRIDVHGSFCFFESGMWRRDKVFKREPAVNEFAPFKNVKIKRYS